MHIRVWTRTFVILMPRCFMRASRRRFSSGKGTAGLATSDVSSRNTHVGEKGIAYRNVGSFCGGNRIVEVNTLIS
jgi:hypothetical protein